MAPGTSGPGVADGACGAGARPAQAKRDSVKKGATRRQRVSTLASLAPLPDRIPFLRMRSL
jgi:hypothetical protein